jgi:type I restriction enzyme, S subunit
MNWPKVRLDSVAAINPRPESVDHMDKNAMISFVSMSAVSDLTFTIDGEEERRLGDVVKGYTSFRRDDVLMAKITPCFENGKVAIATIGHERGYGSTEFHVIRPDPQQLLPQYIYYYLRQAEVRSRGEKRMTGSAGQRRVPAAFFQELQIPLPPLADQQRIAAILDCADTLRAKRRAALVKLDDLLQASFIDMFGDPVTNPKGWDVMELRNTFSVDPQLGTIKPAHEGGKQKVIRVGELGKFHIDLTQCGSVTLDQNELKRFEVLPGDFLLARAIGSESHLGKSSIVQELEDRVVYDSHVMRLRFNMDILHPFYFWQWMKSSGGRSLFMKQAGRTAVQFNINAKQISSISIALPPISEQRRFVEFFEATSAIKNEQSHSLSRLDTLFHSLQQCAFQGDL